MLGEKELEKYLVDEIQEVYRLQGVNINDKHIEVIARQMMRWVKVEEVGDTEFLLDEQVDKFRFRLENERAKAKGGKPAIGRALLLGITKASLATDSLDLGRVVPGNNPRPYRSLDSRCGGSPPRVEGKRDHGPVDSGGHRLGVLPELQAAHGNRTTPAPGRYVAGGSRHSLPLPEG